MTTNIFSLIIVLGILVFIHELGHFVFARLFGVGVEKFSLGFGPRICGKKIGITDYRISAIPLGGYVKMVGEEPDAELPPEDLPLSFTHKHVFKRILIVAAGPVFNFLLAVIIYFGLFQFDGVIKPVIGEIVPLSAAENSGLKKGDLVQKINQAKIKSWDEMAKKISRSEGQPLEVTVLRGDSTTSLIVKPELEPAVNEFGEEIQRYGIGVYPVIKPVIGRVQENSAAHKGGLKSGDQIVEMNGIPVETWEEMSKIITSSNGNDLEISIRRKNAIVKLNITPELTIQEDESGEKTERYMIGVATSGDFLLKKLGPVDAFTTSISYSLKIAKLIGISVVKIIKGSISSKELGGPIMIAKMAGDQARVGAVNFISFIAFISINLGILNFLPIPVLDGGHLVFFGIEAVLRRPVNTRIREIAQQVGMSLLLLLMIFVFYNDFARIFSG